MKPAKSMAHMDSRLQTLKLVLKQPKPASVFKFLDVIWPKSLADKVKDILRTKEMDPNAWTVKDVGDIAIRLEKAQGEDSLRTTSKPASTSVLPSVVASGSSGKSPAVTCYNCRCTGHMKNWCPYKNSKPTKKAVTNARSSFANPKAKRSDNKRCYTYDKHSHIARECPQRKVSGNMDKSMKGKPWSTHHKINIHSSESCWAMHPELRPSYLKERAAQSAQQAKVVTAKSGNNLNVKPKPPLFSATKTSHSDASQTMDSYYAELVVNESPHHVLTPFAVNAQAARVERRSAQTQGLRRVTQADMPLSCLPYLDAQRKQYPVTEPAPPVVTDDLGSFVPRQYRSPRGSTALRGKDVIDQDSLDVSDLSHYSIKESGKEEMPESFGYLSEENPDCQGSLEVVTKKQLSGSHSMLKDGSREESANDHKASRASETPQKGRPSEPFEDESTKEILTTLSSRDHLLLISTQPPAEDIPGVQLTRDTLSSGTLYVQKNGPPRGEGAVGKKYDGESFLPGQQSTFDKLMSSTLSEEVVCRDQMIEPVIYSNNVGRVSHIRDPAPMDWSDQDRRKYHQVELQALLGRPIPADTQLVICALGQRSFDGWLGVVIRQMFRPVPRPGFHSAVFKRKRLQGRTSYPTFLDMGPSSNESMKLQGLRMTRISVASEEQHFGNLLKKLGQVLLTPGQYRLLGARIVVLLKEISKLPMLPIHTKLEEEAWDGATHLEVEYGMALLEYMLKVARGFYNNTISLEGRTNKTAILLVNCWWCLHRKADYMMKVDIDRRLNCTRVPEGGLVSYRKILHDADVWSYRMLFNHLAYAPMRCSDQGFVPLDQLLSSTELGTMTSMQQMAQYKEAALVQKGPAQDAFVAAVLQRLVDKLQDCRQFIRGEKAEVKFEAPTAPLTSTSADTLEKATPAKKQTVVATPAPPASNNKVEGIRHSKHIAAARNLTVVAENPTITGADKT
jgi:hypothetical protein